jgi:hypothetical protein
MAVPITLSDEFFNGIGDIQPVPPHGYEWLLAGERAVGNNATGRAMLARCCRSRFIVIVKNSASGVEP